MTDEKTWIQIQNEPIKELAKRDLKLAASRKIRDDNGLTLYSITGNQQGGKSSYGMLILWEMFNGDIDQIMSHIVMSATDFTNIIDAALSGGYREKCIMWDDMSVGGSAATWMTDPLLVKYMSGLGDTLGVATKSLILTSPSGDMIKAFRNYSKYKVVIANGKHKYDRVARGYWIGKSPMDQRYCSAVFEDYYDTRIPFYEIYAKKRKEISLTAVRNMKSLNQRVDNAEPITKKISIKDRARELYRDWKAGVFGEMTLVAIAKAHKIDYGYIRNVSL
jgi:hypothetical protein